MRVVVVVFAALMTLGLAAFGVVAAQRAAGSDSLIALAVHVISPGQTNSTATPPSTHNPVRVSPAPTRHATPASSTTMNANSHANGVK